MKKLGIKITAFLILIILIFSFIQIFFVKSEVNAAGLSSSYTQYVKSGISAFPESYQKKLAYLKYLYPNWEFKAYYTGIDWNELTSGSAENQCKKNTIYKGGSSNLLDPSALCKCGQQGDGGYYCASAKAVNYYLDPRNFLGEAMVFQFLDLSNGEGVTRDVVASATSGTYLSQYVDDIMAAASEANINPLHIVATIFQELGRTGTPKAISGTVSGYEGVYNFYNYGATDGSGAVERGLAKAKELGWTTPRYALVDGAKKVLANDYISAGQTTKYFYKFDVVGNEILTESAGEKTYSISNFYWHQYMTNLRDPASQAGSLYDIYAESGILDQHLTFTIPVYNNMPSEASATPTTLTGNNLYYINSQKVGGINFRQTAGGSFLGYVYKGTVVELLENQGYWSKVKINVATSYAGSDASGTYNKWNYQEKIGYVATEYLAKVGTEVEDHRNDVDMGGGTTPVTPDSGGTDVVGTADFKVDGDYIVMTPATTVKNVKEKNTTAVVAKSDGTTITDESTLISTGDIVTIGDKKYTCVKYGDVNGDGKIKASDYVLIKNHIMEGTAFTDIQKLAADVNKDGSIKASDYVLIKNYIMNGTAISL